MEEAACIAAGFFVTKPAARGASRSPDLLPPQLVSLSRCIAPSYQVFWGWDVEKHKAEAFAFGIPADRVSELHPWEKTHGITYPNVFHSRDDARAFVVAFLPAPHDVIILGASLPLALTDEFLVHHKRRVHHMQTNTYTDTCYGMNLVLTARQPLPEGGERRGFAERATFEQISITRACCVALLVKDHRAASPMTSRPECSPGAAYGRTEMIRST